MKVTGAVLGSLCLAAAAAAPVLAQGDPAAGGNPAAGKTVFNQCLACHTIEPGKWKIGPSLWGVVGRESGTLPGFNYSTAMKNFHQVWTPDELFTYLAAPMKVVPGTKMAFPGLPKEQSRRDVIAYLETLK